MQRRKQFAARAAIAAVAFAASPIALAPAHAAPADTCLKAPKGLAPQGSHWYYRLERPSQRKCWYLAEKGLKVAARPAVQAAPPQAEPDDADDATPAPAAPTPVAAKPVAAPVAAAPTAPSANVAPQPVAEAPAPKITTLVTRNVSNADQPMPPATQAAQPAPAQSAQPAPMQTTQPVAAPSSPPMIAAAVPAAAPVQAPADQQAPRAISETPPVAPALTETASAAPEQTSTLQVVLGAIALLGFLASAALFIMALRRRRNDVLNMRREADILPYEHSPEMAADDDAAFQPLRALDPIRRHDDVDEAMRRVMRRRRAAA